MVPVAPPTLPLPAAAPLVDASLLNGLAVGDTAVLPSSSGGGGYFIKRLPDSKWTCSCPDFKFRKRKLGLECKHIQAVRAGIPPQSIIKARRTPSAHHTTAPCYRWRWPRETRLAPGKLGVGRTVFRPAHLSTRSPALPDTSPTLSAITFLALVAARAGRPRAHQAGAQDEERAQEAPA